MKSKNFSRVMAVILTAAMLMGLFSVTAFATIPNWSEENVVFNGSTFGTNGYYNVISKKDYVLVPGAATETEMVLNNTAGNRRQVLHIIEVDPSNPDVSILPGYYGIDKFAADPTNASNQKAAGVTAVAEYYDTTLGYQVVGAMNTALAYDNNAPFSYLVYNGEVLVDAKGGVNNFHSGACATMLCVYKDDVTGECSCELRTHAQGLRGDEWQAIGANFSMTVNNGALVNAVEERSTEMAARSMVGVKEDGTLVLVMNDGRNANNSKGFNTYELGESMLALGCKWAFNCDGGGSSSFVTRRAGEDDLVCRCVPCDGAERPTLNSVIVVSNVAPTGVFDSANITSEYDYFAPNTTYTFAATALDTHGYAMDMPAGATWTLSDNTFGTIANGVFASNGKLGTVTVQVVLDNVVRGEKEITIANPTTLNFTQASTVLPYGKTTTLAFTSLIGEAKVFLDGNSFDFDLSVPSAGVLNGLNFTATSDETVAGTVITATYLATSAELTYTITFGKGSEILWNFEDNDLHGFLGHQDAYDWQIAHGVETPFGYDGDGLNTLIGRGQISTCVSSTAFISTEANGGKVHNGSKALGYTFDMTQVDFNSWVYAVIFNISNVDGDVVLRDVANGKKATAFGCWVYVPYGFYTVENSGALALQANLFGGASKAAAAQIGLNMQYNGKNLNALTEADIPENRWVYAVANISGYNYVSLVDPLQMNYRSPSIMRMYVKPSVAQTLTYYFDDFTLDYSSAVDDRVPPVISNPEYAPSDANIAFADGVTITEPSSAFTAYVSDANSGIDASTAQIYVDGKPVTTNIAGNMMYCAAVSFGAGTHKVKFEVADNLGNYTTLTRTLVSTTVDSSVAQRVRIEVDGHNDSDAAPMPGSVYYIDVVKTAGAALNSAEFTLSLNTANAWIPEEMTVADGYHVTYTVNPTYPNQITFTCTSTGSTSARETIATIPVSVYNPLLTNGVSDGAPVTVSGRLIVAPLTVEAEATIGGTYGNYDAFNVADIAGQRTIVRHDHTASAIADVAATCTTDGYTGRTYCDVCQSVVDWGTKLPAGHTYARVGNQFVCSVCSDVYEPGTGLFEMNNKYYYFINNTLIKGWQDIDGVYHLFMDDYAAATGTHHYSGDIYYQFADNGMLLHDVFVTDENGIKCYYGPSNYVRGWQTIEGERYYFDEEGYALTGYGVIRINRNDPNSNSLAYLFDEEGKYIEDVTSSGLITTGKGEVYYIEDGETVHAGLIKVYGYYYYITGTGKAAVGSYTVTQSWTNDLLDAGTYDFDARGRLIREADGDLDLSGGLDASDVIVMQSCLLAVEDEDNYACDLNNDGVTNILDLIRLKRTLAEA